MTEIFTKIDMLIIRDLKIRERFSSST